VSVPRLSYLALLLPRCAAFFGALARPGTTADDTSANGHAHRPPTQQQLECSSFHHDGVLLRNLPVGLLADLYAPAEVPWRLTVGEGVAWDISDTFLNCAKEVG
jgi:autophagy-related protein 5